MRYKAPRRRYRKRDRNREKKRKEVDRVAGRYKENEVKNERQIYRRRY
jgi:hypothetical protein